MFYYIFLPFTFVASFINQGGYVLIVLFIVALYMWFLISERFYFYKFEISDIVKDSYESFQNSKEFLYLGSELEIILNGGIDNLKDCKNLLNNYDGIMLGRKIYDDPLFLLDVEKEIFNNVSQESLKSIMNKYLVYVLNLPNQKDINRALNHFMQLIKVISKNKKVRNEILDSLKNKDISIEDIFIDLKEDLLRKDLALNL